MVVDSGITKGVVTELTARLLALVLTEPNEVSSVEEKPGETIT